MIFRKAMIAGRSGAHTQGWPFDRLRVNPGLCAGAPSGHLHCFGLVCGSLNPLASTVACFPTTPAVLSVYNAQPGGGRGASNATGSTEGPELSDEDHER